MNSGRLSADLQEVTRQRGSLCSWEPCCCMANDSQHMRALIAHPVVPPLCCLDLLPALLQRYAKASHRKAIMTDKCVLLLADAGVECYRKPISLRFLQLRPSIAGIVSLEPDWWKMLGQGSRLAQRIVRHLKELPGGGAGIQSRHLRQHQPGSTDLSRPLRVVPCAPTSISICLAHAPPPPGRGRHY